jgi:predicted exporter
MRAVPGEASWAARLPVVLWLAWLAIAGWILAARTPVATDLTFFLPREAGLLDIILVHQMREGPASRLLLIALEGRDAATRAAASHRLTDTLQASPLFLSVSNGPDLHQLTGLEQRLFPWRYALSPGMKPDDFTVLALRRALTDRLAELASPAGLMQKTWLARDPTGEWLRLLKTWLPAAGPALHDGVWSSPDGERALILARTRASGFDLDRQARAQQQVREAFASLPEAAGLRLVLGGPGALGVEANARIKRDAARLSIINSLLVMALIFGVYRSWRILGLGLVPLVTGLMTGGAATSLIFGGIHGITLGFGATLVGVAADYPNHYFTHLAPRETPASAMARIWPTLRLGLLTNVAGFAGMLFSGFAGLAQLGVFAGVGLLAAGLSTRWVLPALWRRSVNLPGWVELGLPSAPVIGRRGRWLPPLLTLAALLVFVNSGAMLWNDDVAALNPIPPARQQRDEQLQRDFNAPDLRQLVVVTGPDAETTLRRSEAVAEELASLREQGVLTGFEHATRYLPSSQRQAERLAGLPDAETLRRRLRQAVARLPFRREAFAPFLEEVERARSQPPITLDDLQGTPLADLVGGLLLRLPTGWAALMPLSGIRDADLLAQRLAALPVEGVYQVDLRAESSRLMRDYRREALTLLAASLALIAALLGLGLRSAAEALRVLAPVLLAGLCTGLIMATIFHGLNLYHLVSLLLVMGLSLDQALFFNRDAADPAERRRTLLSLLICGSSSILAFGTLAFSSINILQAIGATVALGAVLAIGFAALLAQRPGVPR